MLRHKQLRATRRVLGRMALRYGRFGWVLCSVSMFATGCNPESAPGSRVSAPAGAWAGNASSAAVPEPGAAATSLLPSVNVAPAQDAGHASLLPGPTASSAGAAGGTNITGAAGNAGSLGPSGAGGTTSAAAVSGGGTAGSAGSIARWGAAGAPGLVAASGSGGTGQPGSAAAGPAAQQTGGLWDLVHLLTGGRAAPDLPVAGDARMNQPTREPARRTRRHDGNTPSGAAGGTEPDPADNAANGGASDAGTPQGSSPGAQPGSAGSGSEAAGAQAPGEAGSSVSDSAGASGSAQDPSAAGTGASPAEPSVGCAACREANCRDYMGLGADLVAGCYDKIDPIAGADPNDASFLQDCQGMMQCADQSACAYGSAGPAACYCGSASIDECMQTGPAADAPCVAQFEAATRSTDSAQISNRSSDFAYPMAWAYYLLQCDRDLCRAQCVPQ
jgi:hypothetical protein